MFMCDPEESSKDNMDLKKKRSHCTCGHKGICSTCVYFIQKEVEEMAGRENDSKKQRD